MIDHLRLGIKLFIKDMKESVPLLVTFAIVILAFVLALAVATGFKT